MSVSKQKILIIYTGGTIGMEENPITGKLRAVRFNNILEVIPELQQLHVEISVISTDEVIDSSNMQPQNWVMLAELIYSNYEEYDGFVILHGTDTMAYTASAVSFMFEGLNKPIIFTGSQLPIGKIRTDGKENLITSVEIASTTFKGKPVVSEVCVFFENELYRANRSKKRSAELFNAFESPNYPLLAEAGIEIKYNFSALKRWNVSNCSLNTNLETSVGVVFLHPGIDENWLKCAVDKNNSKAVILLTYGSGNAPTHDWFLNHIREQIDGGMVVLNLTQCSTGAIRQGVYETSHELDKLGVISGIDMTLEAALAKFMYVLGNFKEYNSIKAQMEKDLRGELTSLLS